MDCRAPLAMTSFDGFVIAEGAEGCSYLSLREGFSRRGNRLQSWYCRKFSIFS